MTRQPRPTNHGAATLRRTNEKRGKLSLGLFPAPCTTWRPTCWAESGWGCGDQWAVGEGQCFERRSVRYQWWEWRWPGPGWSGEAEKVDLTLCCDSLCAAVGCCSALWCQCYGRHNLRQADRQKIRSYGYPAVIWIVWTRISVINDGKEMKIVHYFDHW